MKKDYPDAQRKKLVGELLKNADRLLKSGEYDEALSEVEKSLELEPGNFYAQAYKERIGALREKHGAAGAAAQAAAPDAIPVDEAIPEAEIIPDVAGGDQPAGSGAPPADGDIENLREQHERESATQESEVVRRAGELTRRALEQEINQGAAAEKLIAAERELTDRAIGEGRARARSEFISRSEAAVDKHLDTGDVGAAFAEVARLTIVDPGNTKLRDLAARVEAATGKTITPAPGGPEGISRETAEAVFGNILKAAWMEGTPNEAQAAAIETARKRLEITPEEEKTVMSKVQRELIAGAMREGYRDGDPDPETKSFLDRLTTELSEGARSLR